MGFANQVDRKLHVLHDPEHGPWHSENVSFFRRTTGLGGGIPTFYVSFRQCGEAGLR
jgi:hypothetical protein